MSTTPSQSRALVCSFTYANGHHCRMPRNPSHLFLCTYHARKEAQALAADQVGRDLADHFSGNYLSACDLSAALGHLMCGSPRSPKPRAASTLAYLSQTLLQAIHLSEHEYINAHGTDSWRREIRAAFAQAELVPRAETPERRPEDAEPPEPEALPANPTTYVESTLTKLYQNK